MERISQEQEAVVQTPNRWQRCRRGIAQYCRQEAQVFSSIYRDLHKDDQWGMVRQVGASMAAGAMIGCSIVIPLYVIYQAIHGLAIDNDITSSLEVGSIGGGLLTTYKIMLSPVVRRWSSQPRPIMKEGT